MLLSHVGALRKAENITYKGGFVTSTKIDTARAQKLFEDYFWPGLFAIDIKIGTMYSSSICCSNTVPCLMISSKAFINAKAYFLSKVSMPSARMK